jgi:hypothetical protein
MKHPASWTISASGVILASPSLRGSNADIDTSADGAGIRGMLEEPGNRGVTGSIQEYRLSTCATQEDRSCAASLRYRLFQSQSRLNLDEDTECARDEAAILLGLLRKNREPVSTARSVPFPSPFSTLSEIGISSSEADSEVGRLAAVPGAESIDHALLVLALGALWVERNSAYRTFISYAHPSLIPLYLEIGACDTGQTCRVPGRDSTHKVLIGSYADCARLVLTRLGIARRDALQMIV